MMVKIPPAIITALFALLMYLLDKFLPVGEFVFFGRKLLMYIVLILGILVALVALLQFWKAKTTIDPLGFDKTNRLVTSGIFSYTRNPMYLGLLLLLIAWGLHLGNAFNTLLAAGFVYYMNHFQIRYEEEALQKKFGKQYQLYCKAVRRWF